jgi:DedD protein
MASRAAKTERGAVDPAEPFKRRARRRLLGALIFAALIASVLPMLLDPEPSFERPALHLDIPSRDTALPAPTRIPETAAVSSAPEGVPATTSAPETSAPKAAVTSPLTPPRPAVGAPGSGTASGPSSALPPTPPKAMASAAPPVSSAPVSRPPTETPRTSPPPSPPAASSRWLVQVGLFGRPENASALVVRIRSLGLPVFTETVQPGARTRVRVGPFSTRAEAERARARLTLNNIEATLVSP